MPDAYLTDADQKVLHEIAQWWRSKKGSPDRPYYRETDLYANPVPMLLAKANEDIAASTGGAGSTGGTFDVWSVSSTGGDQDDGREEHAYDWLQTGVVDTEKAFLYRHHQSGRLYFAGSRTSRWGKTAANVTAGNTVVVAIWQTTGGGWEGWDEYAGFGYTAYLPPTHAGLPSGCPVLIEKINGRWIIVKPHSLHIQGLTTADVATSDATFTIDNVESMIGPVVVVNAAAEVTITNTHTFEHDENAYVKALWNGASQIWDEYQGDCPAAS